MTRSRLHLLTRREIAILRERCRGHNAVQIGFRFSISERTVESHLLHIGRKLDCRGRAAMAHACYLLGRHDQLATHDERRSA
jgi:DNA-binding CsgD family transcriptional regulator